MRRQLAQIITVILIVLSVVCCLCGGLLSLVALNPLPGDSVVLPNGEIATGESLQSVTIIILCLCGVLAFTILLAGLGVWFVFGREQSQSNLWARATAVFALVGSVFFGSWALLVAVTGNLTDGMTITGEQVGILPTITSSIACLIPAGILACASLVIWWFFIRGKRPLELTRVKQPPISPIAAFLTFIQDMPHQADSMDSQTAASIRARTLLVLNTATVVEKAQLLHSLYKAGLINGENPQIMLNDADFSQLNLSDINLTGINLKGANLGRATLHETKLAGTNIQETILHDADLRFADLAAANLQDANLQAAKLHNANLRGANLQGANLAQANLWRADLTNAKVTEEQLAGVKSLAEAIRPDGTKA